LTFSNTKDNKEGKVDQRMVSKATMEVTMARLKNTKAYTSPLTLLLIFIYLKGHKSGVSLETFKDRFFPTESLRNFQRRIKSYRETFIDEEGNNIFHVFEVSGIEKQKKITLNPKYLIDEKTSFEEQQVFSVMLADCLMANIKKCNDDIRSDLSISDLKTELINFLTKKNLDYAEEEDEDFDEEDFVKQSNAEKIRKKLRTKFYSKKTGYKVYAEDEQATSVLDAVVNALYKSCKLKIVYKSRSAKESKEHIIKPYTLLEHSGVYYIMGAFDQKRKPVLFSVDRLKSAKMLKDKFSMPVGYDPANIVEKGIGVGDFDDIPTKVELLFKKEVAYYIKERFWHQSQFIEDLDDGSVKLTLIIPLGLELNRLILSFGSMVKVLSPYELAMEIKNDRDVPVYDDIESLEEDDCGKEKFLHIIVRPKEIISKSQPVKWDSKGKKLISIISNSDVYEECKKAKANNKAVYIHRTSFEDEKKEIPEKICGSACIDKIKDLGDGKYEISFSNFELLNNDPVYNYKRLKKGNFYYC
jgi:predicted DNA-binding transcriptional regulator YafY